MRDVRDVIVVASRAGLHHPEHTGISVIILVPEDGPHTQVFRVFVHNFGIGRRPRDASSFTKPRDSCPEVDPLLDTAFFAFVSRDLREQKWNKSVHKRKTNQQILTHLILHFFLHLCRAFTIL